jgi:hypothetical protein
MSYNYEINNNIHKKNNEISKYIYKNNEDDSQTYVFELIFKDKFKNIKVIRRIKKSNRGNLVSNDDNISYNIIEKYKLTVLDINYPEKPIIVKEYINCSLSTNSYLTNNIYLEVNQTYNNMLEFNYHIDLYT